MKKLVKILALSLVLVFSLSLVACGSSYGKLEEAFTKKGYEVSEQFETAMTTIKNQLEKEELVVEAHCLKGSHNPSGTISYFYVLILEFKNTEDLAEACDESATLRGLMLDVKEDDDFKEFYNTLVEKGYANGNCLVVTTALQPDLIAEVKNIVKNA